MNYDTRINKIIGQLEALRRLSGEGKSGCDKVLQQVNAVQGGVSSLKRVIIEDSLQACADEKQPHAQTKELLTSIRRYL
jgi:DNA-binding FrmR family transcriptional regulator